MNRDLFLSLLALDSYNRGYEAGLILDPSAMIGTATIGEDAETLLTPGSAQTASFYAIAYNWNGETIISYRGTDNLLVDAVTGYLTGAGYNSVQGDLAIDFYEAVTGCLSSDKLRHAECLAY